MIRALIAVHVFGHPCDVSALAALAKRWNLVFIEDAAEALGTLYQDKPAGSFGTLAALSFNGNKIVTAGNGGAVVCNDAELAARARHLTTTAKEPHPYEFIHNEVGYNYRLSNLNAALGNAQLQKLHHLVDQKRKLAAHLQSQFVACSGVRFLCEPTHAQSNYWLNALVLETPDMAVRNSILERTNEQNVMTRPLWRPMHLLPAYQSCARADDLSVAEHLYAGVINLPSSASLAPYLCRTSNS